MDPLPPVQPCFNCGKENTPIHDSIKAGTYVFCNRCGVTGPKTTNTHDAIIGWNNLYVLMKGRNEPEVVLAEDKFTVKINGELDVTRDQLGHLMKDVMWNLYDRFTVSVVPFGEKPTGPVIRGLSKEIFMSKDNIFDKLQQEGKLPYYGGKENKTVADITDHTMRLK